MADQYKIALLILIMTFLINLVTYSDFEEEVSVQKFLKIFYARSAEEPENLRLYIFQVSFWMMVPMLFLVNAANR